MDGSGHRTRTHQRSVESTATGIYGVIVSAAVMSASHAPNAITLEISVLVTLLIYWSAERYSRLVAERIHADHRPTWAHVREQLASGWEFVTASFLPLVVLLVARALGGSMTTSILAALVCSTLLLVLTAWQIGARGRLTLWERAGIASTAGLFGVSLIVLKAFLH